MLKQVEAVAFDFERIRRGIRVYRATNKYIQTSLYIEQILMKTKTYFNGLAIMNYTNIRFSGMKIYTLSA